MKKVDLTDKVYGFLHVEESGQSKYFPNGSYQSTWICKCVCGKKISITSAWLLSGKKTSCGCRNFTGKHGNAKFHPQDTSWKALWQRSLQSAKTRKIEFNLTLEQVKTVATKECVYCGIEPSLRFNVYSTAGGKTRTLNIERCNEGWIIHATIDRINSNAGYSPGNIVPACFACNSAKGSMSDVEFYNWIKRISKLWEKSELSVFQTHIHSINHSLFQQEIS